MSGSDRDSRPKRPPVEAATDDPWAKWRQPESATPVADAPRPERARPQRSDQDQSRQERPRDERRPAAKAGSPWGANKDAVAIDAKAGSRSTNSTAGRAVNPEKRPKSKSFGEAPVRARAVPVSAPADSSADLPEPTPALPVGTLGVRKSATPVERPLHKRPIRGGAVAKRATVSAREVQAKAEPAAPAERPAASVRQPAVRSGPPPEGVRLSKVMSERGMCSRREADLWIERGWVLVNGEVVSELGSRIDPAAEVTISKDAKKDQAKQVTILIHKPVGYVSGQPEPDCVPAVTLITADNQVPQPGDPEFKPWMLRGLAPAGRLDIDSTGLLVLTSDGRVAKRLIGEDSEAEKEYLVRVSGEMIKGGLDLLRHGLELDGKPLKPAWVKQLNEDQLHFILKEGKKRQIRRMCELVGLQVVGLKRVRIGRIRLGDLPMGQWRFLRADEAF
jgi:23S rRNA pseudouridine2604 synthase